MDIDKIKEVIKQHPMATVGIIVALIAIYYLYASSSSSASTSTTSTSATSAQQAFADQYSLAQLQQSGQLQIAGMQTETPK